MKKLIVLLLVSQCVFSLFAQSDALDYYAGRFNGATSVAEQHNVLQTVASEKLDGSAAFFADALKRLLWQIPDTRTVEEKAALEESLRIITHQLSEEQYAEAATDLWRVVERFSNPIIRSDALIALGKIGDATYLPRIIRLLEQNSMYETHPREDGERLAYGAISALRDIGEPAAYMPVFAAANGWYSRWIKEFAAGTSEEPGGVLKALAEDPGEQLVKGINNTFYSYQTRYQALIALENSSTSDELKSQGAQDALRAGWTFSPLTSREVVSIRKDAIKMLAKYGVSDDQVYRLLWRSYTQAYDMEEQMAVVQTLSTLGTDQAVKLLVSFIYEINERQRYGTLQDTDERLIRALIPALSKTGSSEGDKVLTEITLVDWTHNIHELARQSITDSAK